MSIPHIYYGDPLVWHSKYGNPEVVSFVSRNGLHVRFMTRLGQVLWAHGEDLVVLRRTSPIPYDLADVD